MSNTVLCYPSTQPELPAAGAGAGTGARLAPAAGRLHLRKETHSLKTLKEFKTRGLKVPK